MSSAWWYLRLDACRIGYEGITYWTGMRSSSFLYQTSLSCSLCAESRRLIKWSCLGPTVGIGKPSAVFRLPYWGQLSAELGDYYFELLRFTDRGRSFSIAYPHRSWSTNLGRLGKRGITPLLAPLIMSKPWLRNRANAYNEKVVVRETSIGKTAPPQWISIDTWADATGPAMPTYKCAPLRLHKPIKDRVSEL